MSETRFVTRAEVIAYHRRVLLDSGQSPLVINSGRLDAAIARPSTTAFGEDAFPTLSEKVAALLMLELNGFKRETTLPELYDFTIAVTTGELREVDDIAERLRQLFPGLS